MYLGGAETKRLYIRKLNISDIAIWETFFKNNTSLEYLGLDLSLDAEIQSKDWIERQLWRYEHKQYGYHALIHKNTNEFIGQCGLLTQEIDGNKEVEIGYHILPEYWGLGFATEVAQLFRNYAFDNDLCHSLVSIIDIRNIASQKVAEKIGMQRGKQVRYHDLNVYIYRIYKGDYLSMR